MDAKRAWTQTQKGQELPELTEQEARSHLESLLWPNGPVCAHCGATNVYRMRGLTVRAGLHRCRSCKKTFTVTVGTIFEDSHIPLSKWIKAFHLMCSSKKGISALQLQRNLGLGSYRTAWFMCHRVRLAMKAEPMAGMLKGTVEVDEAYIGGKPRKGTGLHKRGRGTSKAPVVVLVERGGKAHSQPVENVDGFNLKRVIREMVDKSATICTDELGVYNRIGEHFAGGHHIVNHGRGEFVRGSASTNTAESYFAILKRGIMGTFHRISKRHLHRYCDEFAFRWNIRELPDSERREIALGQTVGKRLVYKELASKPANGLNFTEFPLDP
jgi:transposase-like protein